MKTNQQILKTIFERSSINPENITFRNSLGTDIKYFLILEKGIVSGCGIEIYIIKLMRERYGIIDTIIIKPSDVKKDDNVCLLTKKILARLEKDCEEVISKMEISNWERDFEDEIILMKDHCKEGIDGKHLGFELNKNYGKLTMLVKDCIGNKKKVRITTRKGAILIEKLGEKDWRNK